MSRQILFVHDGPMFTYGTKCYHNQINNELVDRYAYFGDKVCFLMRDKSLQKKEITNYQEITHSAFSFVSIPNSRSLATLFKKGEVGRIIRNQVLNSDIIIVRLPSAAGVMAFRIAMRENKPLLVEVVACVYDALWNYDWRGKILAHYKLHEYKRLIKSARYVMYVTEHFLQSRYPASNGVSIGCSDVELGKLNHNVLENRLKKIVGLNINTLTLGTVAALDVPYKGQSDVIKSIKYLKNKGVNVNYKLVGQGDQSSLKRLITSLDLEQQIEIIGPLPHSEVFNFLDNIDVYIQPSAVEGLPRALVEAMSKSLPCVGTQVGGIPELLEESFMYNKSKPRSMEPIILSLFDKEAMIIQVKRNFAITETYQRKVLYEKRIAFYDEFLQNYNLK